MTIFFFSHGGFLSLDLLKGRGRGVDYFSGVNGRHHHQSLVSEQKFDSDLAPPRPRSAEPVLSPKAYAALFPDWEALVLLSLRGSRPSPSDRPLCLFQDGSTSPVNFSGELPLSRRAAFRCSIQDNIQRLRRILAPKVVLSKEGVSPFATGVEVLSWKYLVYESLSTADDVIVLAKGVNRRSGTFDRGTSSLRCVFVVPGAAIVHTPATSSSQEVFRCRHPSAAQLQPLLAASANVNEGIRISLEIHGQPEYVPSLPEYQPPTIPEEKQRNEKFTLCACTMAFNVAKFLPEWVMYHHRIGVEKFILYDNGSEDKLGEVMDALGEQGYNVSSVPWLLPKTQEASFSHCAVAHRDRCRWMMYLDVDEFAFSPSWSKAASPSFSMLQSIWPVEAQPWIGQLSLDCLDFGPSNRTAHPGDGVTQGYTCRRQQSEHHKSIVLLEAVDPSLCNVIHHFKLGFARSDTGIEYRYL